MMRTLPRVPDNVDALRARAVALLPDLPPPDGRPTAAQLFAATELAYVAAALRLHGRPDVLADALRGAAFPIAL